MLQGLKSSHQHALSAVNRLHEFSQCDVESMNKVSSETIQNKVSLVSHLIIHMYHQYHEICTCIIRKPFFGNKLPSHEGCKFGTSCVYIKNLDSNNPQHVKTSYSNNSNWNFFKMWGINVFKSARIILGSNKTFLWPIFRIPYFQKN